MGWGDEILAAGQAQRLYQEHGTPVAILDTKQHPRWHPMWEGNPAIVRPNAYIPGEVRSIVSAPEARPYIIYPFTKETGWTFNPAFRCRDHIARIYLTQQERQRGQDVLHRSGPYVLIEPYTKHENFRWPLKRWNELVASLPQATFVQHMHSGSEWVYGCYREQASFRDACGLIASALLYVRSESGLCHAAAALGVPQVTLFGGCMDADIMGGYPGQTCIVDDSPETPCGSWMRCEHCIEAMDRITVERVRDAIVQALGRVH
jgi:Glycosyltransferase family 9 (heptosyltransferase)